MNKYYSGRQDSTGEDAYGNFDVFTCRYEEGFEEGSNGSAVQTYGEEDLAELIGVSLR